MVVSGNQGGADVKHPRCQQQERDRAPLVDVNREVVSVCVRACPQIFEYMHMSVQINA